MPKSAVSAGSRHLRCLAAGALTLALTAGQAVALEQREDRGNMVPDAVAAARDEVFPALIHVEVLVKDYGWGGEMRYQSNGSGTIITPDGLVLTNAHVTDNGERYWVTLTGNQRVGAELVGQDEATDLAVLRIDLEELEEKHGTTKPLPFALLSDVSDDLQIGEPVLAMGSPFSLDKSVTQGIVSNPKRVFTAGAEGRPEAMNLGGERTGQFTEWIQHDALINPGNSGGPLVNLRGEIVGINTRGGSGMAFATPSAMAKDVVRQIIANGEVQRSWIGVDFIHVERTGFDRGVFVNAVDDAGPAHEAGLQPGDLVTAINGEPINVLFAEQVPPLERMIADAAIGDEMTFDIERAGSQSQITFATDRLLKDSGEKTMLREWGLIVQEITPFMVQQRRLETEEGVLVVGVTQGRPASLAEPAVGWGSVLTSIAGKPITTKADVLAAYNEFLDAEPRPERVVVEYLERDRSYVTAMKTEPLDQLDPPRELPKPWLGVITQPVIAELAAQLGHPEDPGFRVARVFPGKTADAAGLEQGDLIVAVNGEPMAPRVMEEAGRFARAIRELEIGDEAELTVLRNGERIALKAELDVGPLTIEQARRDRNRDFGLNVRELTFFDRDNYGWDDDVRGVMIDGTTDSGWAQLGGLNFGLIESIDGQAVRGLKSYRRIMDEITEAEPERVVFVVRSARGSSFKFVEPDWRPEGLEEDNAPQAAAN
ncbi:MAG: trypsin-like peptidase domain-containing protein [Planctomycetota bacterium]